jgi:hypothetical protein
MWSLFLAASAVLLVSTVLGFAVIGFVNMFVSGPARGHNQTRWPKTPPENQKHCSGQGAY